MLFCECGTGSFKHVDEDPEDLVGCTGGSPRRKHGGGKVNPYAERGLDRFSVVLSELETRRARILRRVAGSDAGLVLVRFVQSNGDWTPVVVKLPEQLPASKKKAHAAAAAKKPARAAAASIAGTLSRPPAPAASPRSPPAPASPREGGATAKVVATKAKTTRVPARKASFSWGRRMRRPSCYWPSVLVLTLVSLAVSGRVFAICVASIWWYVLPTLSCGEDARRGPAAGMRMSMEKKRVVSPPPPDAKK